LFLLVQTIHGLKKSASAFGRELNSSLNDMKYERSKADQCLYFCWTLIGLISWLSWIDDCVVAGDEEGALAAKEQNKARFECDDIDWKIKRTQDYVEFTQPVLLQSYVDEFNIESGL
jgi:hypothetical protein